MKYNIYLERSFEKYDKENFKFEILWKCESKDCLYFEQLYLDYYEPWIETGKGYNILKFAANSFGFKHSPETILYLKYCRAIQILSYSIEQKKEISRKKSVRMKRLKPSYEKRP